MSDTPRTDAKEESVEVEQLTYKDEAKVAWHFARELERDNARMTINISRNNAIMSRMAGENAKLREALKWAEPYVPKRADCETRRMIESVLPNAQAQR